MPDQRRPAFEYNESEIDTLFADLGRRAIFPPTPDLRPAIRAALAAAPDRSAPPPIRFPQSIRRRLLYAAAIALVALAATLAAWSDFRTSVADFLGVRGIHIVVERSTPTPTAIGPPTPTSLPAGTPVGTGLLLGRKMSLAEAQTKVPYTIHVPSNTSLGAPDEVYLRMLPDGNQMVSLIYFPDANLPDTAHTGVGLLLMQFEARTDVNYLAKQLNEEPRYLTAAINGHDAIWIAGAHQLTLLSDPSAGCCGGGEIRPSGNVLLWEQDGLTFRLESSLGRDDAIAVARSVARPIATPGN